MFPPATATVSGDSLSSTESSFRQLDDVFLQTQARIWLGEVLHTRFDEQLDISDLLSDGELLCEVSKILWNMLLVKFMELRHVKTPEQILNDSRKSSGRYMPYSNVDSFLKVCKVFGLDGIDLFSPSDVVEKRDTRKVCICIRSLSKKARSKQLDVPDFDIVTYTIAMPTDIVGCIRKSLELSKGRNLSPVHSSCKDRKMSLRQKSSVATRNQMHGSYSEDSDGAKRISTGPQSYVSHPDNSNDDPLGLDLEDSDEVHSTINEHRSPEDGIHLDVQEEEEVGETEQCLYYSDHLPESEESICFRYFSKLDSMSPPGYGSLIMLDHTDDNHPIKHDEDSSFSSYMDNESYGSNSPETSKYEGLTSYPDKSDDAEVSSKMSMTEFPYCESERTENGRVGSRKVQEKAEFQSSLPCPSLDTKESHIGLELENSDLSVESLRSLYSSECQGIELVDKQVVQAQIDSVDALFIENTKLNVAANDLELVDEVRDDDKAVTLAKLIDSGTDIKELADINYPVDSGNNVMDRTSKDSNCTCNCSPEVEERCTISENVGKEDTSHTPEIDVLANLSELSDQKDQCSIDKGSEKQKKPTAVMGPLLKTVAKGTAFIGVMFLLHLRIRNDRERKGKKSDISTNEERKGEESEHSATRERKGEENEDSTLAREKKDEGGEEWIPTPPVDKSNGMKFSSQKGKRGSSEVYPSEKLKL